MAHRINERNMGGWTLDGEPKRRKTKTHKGKPSEEEIAFVKEILQRVFDALEYDIELSERGHLHPDSKWTDGGRFALTLTGEQKNMLWSFIHERKH